MRRIAMLPALVLLVQPTAARSQTVECATTFAAAQFSPATAVLRRDSVTSAARVLLAIRQGGYALQKVPAASCLNSPSPASAQLTMMQLTAKTPAVRRVQYAPAAYTYETWLPEPRGWVGIAFTCSDCGYAKDVRGVRWQFGSAPAVYSVEPGSPAHEAGVRRGDVLTHLNEQPITSEAAGRRWAQLAPGEEVRLRFRRGNATHHTRVVIVPTRTVPFAREVPVQRGFADVSMTAPEPRLRFSGSIGGTDVEVRGLSPVTVSEGPDELIIRVGDTIVRLRPSW